MGEIGIGLNLLEDRRLDRRDLAFDLFEALRIVAFQQRRGKDLAPVLGEMVFRRIDADGIVLHLFRASACHSGLSPGYPFRPKEKTRAIKL